MHHSVGNDQFDFHIFLSGTEYRFIYVYHGPCTIRKIIEYRCMCLTVDTPNPNLTQVSKKVKIRNRYNQVPHVTWASNG